MDFVEVLQLIEREAQEGQELEFKAGGALRSEPFSRTELVKDVTGMANAAGGRLIYGIGEKSLNGVVVAGDLAPITEAKINKDWIAQVLRSNVSPPLQRMDVFEVQVPSSRGGGRVVVVDVEASSTAHQNLLDHRYYQRTGAIVHAMVDFQIRDVMNRTMRPVIEVHWARQNDLISSDMHRYTLTPALKNQGVVTLGEWEFEVDVPREAALALMQSSRGWTQQGIDMQHSISPEGLETLQIRISDPTRDGRRLILHPGREMVLGSDLGLSEIRLSIDRRIGRELREAQLPIRWRLYMPNARPLEGEWPLNDWCIY